MPKEDAARVGQKIRTARRYKGVSQATLAERVGGRLGRDPESVRRTIINSERGRTVPRMALLEAIADELDQPLDFFRSSAEDGAARKKVA